MSPTDPARAEAIRAIAWHLRERDRTAPADRADPDDAAAEILHGLTARGWRRAAALADTPPAPGIRATPDTVRSWAEQARAALTRQEDATDE